LDDVERLEELNNRMANAYQDLCDYLTMDAKTYSLNEFFSDLKSFCTLFLTCMQENRLWREHDEKAARAKMSKQLVDDIRKKHRAVPKNEHNSFFKPSKNSILLLSNDFEHFIRCIDDDETDVVSNLMSVLKDANAASQPRRVRRPPG
jgi:hypothetical protein